MTFITPINNLGFVIKETNRRMDEKFENQNSKIGKIEFEVEHVKEDFLNRFKKYERNISELDGIEDKLKLPT